MTTEELGNLGELKLSELCSQASMVSNPARRDVHGFDNLVQVEVAQDSLAYDLAPAPIRAFFQAKATQRKSGSIGIRLTNWQKMLADSEPWFVFVCEVSAEREVAQIYLVHINEHWMERALRQLRKYTAKKKDLGTKTMAITYGLNERLPRIHGAELRTRVLDAIGADIKTYRDRKSGFYETCGYAAETHRAQVVFPRKSLDQHYLEWSDVALGLRSELDIEHVVVTDQRFKESVVTLDAPAKTMTLRANPTQVGLLQLHNAKLGNHTVPVDIFSTSTIPHIPTDLLKARLKTGPLSLIIDAGSRTPGPNETYSMSTRVSWSHDERCSLADMGDAAQTMMLLWHPGTHVSIQFSASGAEIDFEVGSLPPINRHFLCFLKTAWAIAAVGRHVDLADLELVSSDIEDMPYRALLAGSIVQGAPGVELVCPPMPVDRSKRQVLVIACAFPVADWVVFTCGQLALRATTDEAHTTFTTDGARCLGAWKTPRTQASLFPIAEKQAQIVMRLEKDPELEVFSVDPRTDEEGKALGDASAAVDKTNDSHDSNACTAQ